jgi:hypothetical protein
MVAWQETRFHMFLGNPESARARPPRHFWGHLQSSWAAPSRLPLENATLRPRWRVWEDGLSPSISSIRVGTMQQKGYLVALCSES